MAGNHEGRRPKWQVGRAVASGKSGLELFTVHRDRLERRVPAGFADSLQSAVSVLEGKRDEREVAHVSQKAATKDQNAAAARGVALVAAARHAVGRAPGVSKPVRKAFGVGEKIYVTKVASVTAGLSMVLKAAAAYPEQARAAGLLSDDLATAQALLGALGGADTGQERAKQTAQLKRVERDRARLLVEEAIDLLVAVGQLEFRDEHGVAARFRALVPGRSRTSAPPA